METLVLFGPEGAKTLAPLSRRQKYICGEGIGQAEEDEEELLFFPSRRGVELLICCS